MMQEITGEAPVMWGTSIIGFGTCPLTYANGKTSDWPIVGLSPRKQSLVLDIMPGFSAYEDLLATLGKHKVGKSCLSVKRLSDVDLAALRELIAQSVAAMKDKYGLS